MKKWYYLNNDNEQIGPVSNDDIIELLKNKNINRKTHLWKEGLENWQTIDQIDDFSDTLNSIPPDIPIKQSEKCEQLKNKIVDGGKTIIKNTKKFVNKENIENVKQKTLGVIQNIQEKYKSLNPKQKTIVIIVSSLITVIILFNVFSDKENTKVEKNNKSQQKYEENKSLKQEQFINKREHKTATALTGCVIVSQDGTNMRFKKKCEKCGKLWGTTYKAIPMRGTTFSTRFYCSKCKYWQDAKISSY